MIPNLRRAADTFFVFACLVCACANVCAQTARAEGGAEKPFLHPLFTDHVVLQRGVRFPVWGWTTPGARVKVSMRGAEATATADAGGDGLRGSAPSRRAARTRSRSKARRARP